MSTRFLWTLFIVVNLSTVGFSQPIRSDSNMTQTMEAKALKWYGCRRCEKIIIRYFKTLDAKTPSKQKEITSPEVIDTILSELAKLPTVGEIYVKWASDTNLLMLEIDGDGQRDIVRFYGGKVKTPSTRFFPKSYTRDEEIYFQLKSLLK